MYILGIESSCDDTGFAIYSSKEGLLAHKLFSQTDIHALYGGVVPELASRDHIKRTGPLLQAVLKEANLSLEQLSAIGYTRGPGLAGALLVGATFAKALAYACKIPAIGIHHLEAHLMAVMLEDDKPQFPFLSLIISGGHTLIIEAKAFGEYKVLGQSIDDALGEAFDKTAKMMGLDYPGGPALEKLALQGIAGTYQFPRPLIQQNNMDFSFSGLKTHCLGVFKQSSQTLQDKANIALAFQAAVSDCLSIKAKKAISNVKAKRMVVAGGVSANAYIRKKLIALGQETDCKMYFPRPEFCTDNGAMIAYLTHQKIENNNALKSTKNYEQNIMPKWPIESTDK